MSLDGGYIDRSRDVTEEEEEGEESGDEVWVLASLERMPLLRVCMALLGVYMAVLRVLRALLRV